MNTNLDAYPEFRTRLRGIHDYCENCGQPVLGMGVKCVDCLEQEWIDTVNGLSMDQIMDRLEDNFQGNYPPTFKWAGGFMELTYFGSLKEVEKGKRLMIAYGAVKIHTAEDRMCIYLSGHGDELAIY